MATQHSWATCTKQIRLCCKHTKIYYAHNQVLARVYGAMEKRISRADCCYQNSSESLLLLCLRVLTTWSGNCMQMDEMFWCSARSRLPLFICPDSYLHSNGWTDASHTMRMPFFSCAQTVFSSCNAGGGSKVFLEWQQLTAGYSWQNSPSSSFPTGQGKPWWWYHLRHPKASDTFQLSEKQF